MAGYKQAFDDIAKRWVEDLTVLKPSEVPETVYHYTDAAGLEGTLKSNLLWLTDYRFLNDATEFTFSNHILEEIIDKSVQEADSNMNAFYKMIQKRMKSNGDQYGFVYSLSAEKDDLSQWRGYANDGRGFTIGLDGATIASKADTFSFAKVRYNIENERRSLELAIKEMELELKTHLTEDREENDLIAAYAGSQLAWINENRSAFNKHPSFAGENEWRIVTYLNKGDPEIKVRVSGGRLVPYVATDELLGTKLPIKSIGVGPGFIGSEVVEAVSALATSLGYNPDIYSADTPYRRP